MDPHVAVHGSFSVMVNYHAIGLYCTSRSGFVLHDPQEEASLKVSVLVFTGDEGTKVTEAHSYSVNHRGILPPPHSRKWIGNEVERLSAVRNDSISKCQLFFAPMRLRIGAITCISKLVPLILRFNYLVWPK